ncbi:bcl-2-like protein 1 [Cheilinus undulatus]|uniref:bcl-2-like protein 1 n=1 Tax=Cheilinus undulatus TaxID=241271 RepID=UPI001BD20559|nr:bcl-2-like protein 1 [Cheilinus undulatus]XP_041639788.1 bcl-2-like protein 1 [Cheilinus undulatus]
MSHSNRELVEFFISYKLSQRNFPTSVLRPEDAAGRTESDTANSAASNGFLVNRSNSGGQSGADIEAVKAALQDSADEFELLFTQAFSDLSSQLDITPDTAYHSFKSVMDEVFKDGVNWGRIVGLFVFGGALCVECIQKDMGELVSRIADWMTMYLDERISPWVDSQGGWESFAEIFGRDAAAELRRSRENLTRWLLVGMVLLMGVMVGVYIAKRQ